MDFKFLKHQSLKYLKENMKIPNVEPNLKKNVQFQNKRMYEYQNYQL